MLTRAQLYIPGPGIWWRGIWWRDLTVFWLPPGILTSPLNTTIVYICLARLGKICQNPPAHHHEVHPILPVVTDIIIVFCCLQRKTACRHSTESNSGFSARHDQAQPGGLSRFHIRQ